MYETLSSQKYRLFQKRRNARIVFMQALYIREQTGSSLTNACNDVILTLEPNWRYDNDLLDTLIEFYSEHSLTFTATLKAQLKFGFDRFSLIDKAILKAAQCEFLSCLATDKTVIINEYLEICKEFSEPSSKSIINAVLDKLARSVEQNLSELELV